MDVVLKEMREEWGEEGRYWATMMMRSLRTHSHRESRVSNNKFLEVRKGSIFA